ncbi:hypothetical protein EWM64_g2865 [Hericium alpestre]|uniref:Charged multivesicular body protein 5 n=1 Tax=Hericium alpestre TaxID=135208 RepID=A0A4Z0A493_9AGAM|nr:hypothetical protein EWM64_g2865 [Hericium alpestre]
MNRIFGTSSSKKPKPTLQDAIASTDARVGSIEVKIRKLDGELARYKEQMSKLRNGPGKDAVQQRALRTLKQKRMYEAQLSQLTQQTFNMESTALATENLRNTMATVDAMKRFLCDWPPELDALALEEEEESTSYLADLNKAPDFIDEPPVEVSEHARETPEAIKTTG